MKMWFAKYSGRVLSLLNASGQAFCFLVHFVSCNLVSAGQRTSFRKTSQRGGHLALPSRQFGLFCFAKSFATETPRPPSAFAAQWPGLSHALSRALADALAAFLPNLLLAELHGCD